MTTEVALPTRRAGAPPRHLLSAEDLDGLGLARLLDRAQLLRSDRAAIAPNRPLAGRQVALLFEKPSLRTRVSFEVAVTSLGGHAIALGPDEVGLGRRESAADVARNLSRLVDAVVLRTFAHDTLVEMAEAASVPVINALTDAEHPCQALADLLTLRQRFGRLAGVRLAYRRRRQQRRPLADAGRRARGPRRARGHAARLRARPRRARPRPRAGRATSVLGQRRDRSGRGRYRGRCGLHRRVDQHGAGGRVRGAAGALRRVRGERVAC